MLIRTRKLLFGIPALTTSVLLFASGCSSGPAADLGSTAEPVRHDKASPAAADAPLAIAAAPDTNATPTAVAGTGSPDSKARRSTLRVGTYDRHTQRAVIRPAEKGSSSPSKGPGSTPDHGQVAVGDVIASAPVPGAPDGLLVKVTKVIGASANGTEVQTAPATLPALLGDSTAKGSVPVDPASFDIEPLLPDVKVSWTKTGDIHSGPEGTKVPLGSLRLDVKASVPTPPGSPVKADATVAGYAQVAPEVDFSYRGRHSAEGGPASASLGVSGDWTSQWSLSGSVGGTGSVRVPFAKLHADPVIQAGPVPIVVNLDLTCYFAVTATGKVTVDIEQALQGDFKAGGTYSLGKGWTPVSESTNSSTPVRASVTTAGTVKATLGAQASVGLYGMVGIGADLAPYLRGEGTATVATRDVTSGKADVALGAWALYGGIDLTGTLRLQLSIFGVPIIQYPIPLGSINREWKLAGGTGNV